MAAAAPPLDQFYKLARERLEVALDGDRVTSVDDVAAWADILTRIHSLNPDRNPKRLAATAYRLSQQLVLAQDATDPADVGSVSRLAVAATSLAELMGRLAKAADDSTGRSERGVERLGALPHHAEERVAAGRQDVELVGVSGIEVPDEVTRGAGGEGRVHLGAEQLGAARPARLVGGLDAGLADDERFAELFRDGEGARDLGVAALAVCRVRRR